MKAIKTIPVQGGSYADADADHFTREQVWNATWQTSGKFRGYESEATDDASDTADGITVSNSAFKSELKGKEDGMGLASL